MEGHVIGLLGPRRFAAAFCLLYNESMHIRKCDKCKKKLDEYPSKDGVHGSLNGAVVPGHIVLFDLCGSCAKQFLVAVKRFFTLK